MHIIFYTTGADPNEGNDENQEYGCVLRSRLASHSLVYGAEVDGADPSRYNPPHAHLTPFVELKTNKEITTSRARQILHKFKFQKWWSQSFLVGIPRVICGFRDDAGVVRSVQTFAVSAMPNQCQVSQLCPFLIVEVFCEWMFQIFTTFNSIITSFICCETFCLMGKNVMLNLVYV